jgi:hypothetical protein
MAIPTTKDEDAKRRCERLVGEQTRIVNRMKAALIRLGIRGFNPKLKKAAWSPIPRQYSRFVGEFVVSLAFTPLGAILDKSLI